MSAPHDRDTDARRCGACAAPLAHDQRYCVECGARRGPLPRPVAELLGRMLEQGGGARPQQAPPTAEPTWAFDAELPFGLTMPSPRAAAVAVMAMLTLGVILGTSVAPPVQTLAANAPLVLAVSPHRLLSSALGDLTAPATDTRGGGADNSGGGGGGTETITVTQTTAAPSSPTPAAAASPGAGAPVGSGASPSPSAGSSSPNLLGLPPIKHVFLIVLSDVGFRQSFAPGSADTYVSKTLAGQGKLLYDYYGVAGSGLANGIALISGQGPTPQTLVDCATYAPIEPGTTNAHDQVIGDGCVYPRTIRTVADQLTAKGDTWKAYIEGVDSGPSGQPTACRHPTLGAADADQAPRPGDPYVTWRNPFVYFRSLTHGTACHKNDVGLGGLAFDLQDARTAPTLAYIAPGPCDDGNPQPCNAGSDGGLAAADRFLETVVPEIEQSAAYRDNGLIAITSDEAPQTGPNADSSACCDTPKYPNIPDAAVNTPTTTTSTTTTSTTTTTTTPTTSTTTTPTTSSSGTTPVNGGQTTPTGGGGQVGLLLISKFVKKGSADLVDYYNHYSLLATIENLFGLKRLGYAGHLGLPVFDASIFDHQPAGAAADRGDSRMTIEAVPRTPCEARPLNPVRARTKGTARPAPQSSRPGCMSTKP